MNSLTSKTSPLFSVLVFILFCWSCQSPELQNEDHAIEDLELKKEAWRTQNQEKRFSATIKLSAEEELVQGKLESLRTSMLDAYRADRFFPTAQNFFKVKSHIEQTELFHLLKKMPKGGLLHAHDLALGSADYIVEDVIAREHAYVFWAEKDEIYIKGQLQFFKENEVPKGFESPQKLASQNPNFRKELYDLLTFDAWTAPDSVLIWKEFEKMFQRRIGYVNYRPVFTDFFCAAFDSLLKDNIQHVELRSIISPNIYDLEHGPNYYNRDSMVNCLKWAAARTQQKAPHFTMKIIYTGLRFLPRPIICADLVAAFKIRQAHPETVIGYDLVGEEDGGYPTLYHLDCWDNLDSLAEAYDVDMPLYLHDGESNWHDNENLYDALLLRTKRIGHGINLYRFPFLKELVKENDICLEICPLSNQILKYTPDLRIHPAVAFISEGIAISISSDDPSIYQYEGLTHDFWAAYMAWGLDLRDLKQLSKNGILYGALSTSEKEKALVHWEQDWKQFIKNF